ncbi:MAG: DUF1592 domain-containing protein [Myxococcota bacterium]
MALQRANTCALLWLLACGCIGQIEAAAPTRTDPSSPPAEEPPFAMPDPATCEERGLEVGPSVMTRLTREQYVRTIELVLGVTMDLPEAVSDERIAGTDFHSNIAPLSTVDHVRPFATLARSVADSVDLERILNCPDGVEGESCVRHFLSAEQRGSRLFRRPQTAKEIALYVDLYQAVASTETHEAGARAVVEAILQSPSFLYHATSPEGTGPQLLDDFEVAARLSYFLWNEPPDNPLYRRALADELQDPAVLREEAERLLNDNKARSAVLRFVRRWLGMEEVGGLDPALRESMEEENRRFVEHVVWNEDLPWHELLTSDITFIDARLHAHYGLPGAAPPADAFESRSTTSESRLGLLGQGLYLVGSYVENPNADRFTIMQGKNVTRRFLCDQFERPSLPPDAKQASDFESIRAFSDYLIGRGDEPSCAGTCHQRMDPLGRAFSHFDATGRFIETDHDIHFMGGAVDATGEILVLPEGAEDTLAGGFYGVPGIARHLADSAWVETCFVRQWARFAVGRIESAADSCGLVDVVEQFTTAGGTVASLILTLIASPMFRYVHPQTSDVPTAEVCSE